MSRDASNQVFRQLRAIFVVGPVGGMTDAQLVERFLTHARPDAEEAFAALVARHGPMVMGVCRRMLAGSADSEADDAFQAVFLVLARRAGSIARPDALKSWLYGVAVRTAKEARRRAARRKSREGASMDLSLVGAPPDDGLRELLTVLDEELDRLPSHFRDPLKLCELAGTPRHEAARQLKLPEGTLSSRIARGRLLLRDRLTRRGIALGSAGLASLFSRPADAALPPTLADATVRLSLAFARPGAASPTAALLLAERILSMTPHAPLKLALAAATLIGAVGLSLAWASRPPRIDPVNTLPSPMPRTEQKADDKVVPGEIRVAVRVVDANKVPVVDAAVEVVGKFMVLAQATTGTDGIALIDVPSDARVEWIYALKPNQGFDYAEFGPIGEDGQPQGGIAATELPASASLTFEGTRPAQIKAIDRTGKPLTGVSFTPWLLHKPGRRSSLNVSSPIFFATTDAGGIARFDWLPLSDKGVTFWPRSDGYCRRRVELDRDARGLITAKLTRTTTMRGRVVHSDGSPAQGIQLYAIGSGIGRDVGQDGDKTSVDGSYEMVVDPGETYTAYVADTDWAARSRHNIVVEEGKPIAGVDFELTKGTLLRGTVTVGPDRRPVPNLSVVVVESGVKTPTHDLRVGVRASPAIQRTRGTRTDSEGRYTIRVSSGNYILSVPSGTKELKITTKDEAELVNDFWIAGPRRGEGAVDRNPRRL